MDKKHSVLVVDARDASTTSCVGGTRRKKIIKRFLHKSTDEAWLTKFTCKLGMEILLADKVHKQEPQREMWLYV